jgi:hypothetical protein
MNGEMQNKLAGLQAGTLSGSLSYVEHLCKSGRVTNHEWHLDLTAIDIGKYIEGLPRKKMWWLPENFIGQEVPDSASHIRPSHNIVNMR